MKIEVSVKNSKAILLKDNEWPADYVYEDGHSLTVMDYTDALRVAGCYPSEYKETV